ncbi:hypothetical protein [Streptomyces sp. NPDC058394]|uniref:hypothetical protein n=1 Tax=Streptomyces sp. NPDC058394 TaxID=3346477 RepID=UPI003649730C
MREKNLVGVTPNAGAEQELNGETIKIGSWLQGLKSIGRTDLEGKIENFLKRWRIAYMREGNKIKLSSTVTTDFPGKKNERWRSHLDAYDAWIAKNPQRRGTITGADLHQHNSVCYNWLRVLQETPLVDLDERLANALAERGFIVATSETGTTITQASLPGPGPGPGPGSGAAATSTQRTVLAAAGIADPSWAHWMSAHPPGSTGPAGPNAQAAEVPASTTREQRPQITTSQSQLTRR